MSFFVRSGFQFGVFDASRETEGNSQYVWDWERDEVKLVKPDKEFCLDNRKERDEGDV